MKTRATALLYAQFNPVKTFRQLVEDRNLFRASITTVLVAVLFV